MTARRVVTSKGAVLDLRIGVLGAHSGQLDMSMTASEEGRVVGVLSYSVWQGEPAISMVETSTPRRGVATAMLETLQQEHPGREISWGTTTEDGDALRRSIGFVEVRDADRDAAAARHAELSGMVAEAETEIAGAADLPRDAAAHAALLAKVGEMGDWFDEMRDLEDLLESVPERILLIPTADRPTHGVLAHP